MIDCCTTDSICHTQPKKQTTEMCPVCGHKGKSVAGQTVKALLNDDLRAVRNTPYYFCRTAMCAVVYFNEDGMQTFTESQIRVPVYQKSPDTAEVPLCYCFGYRLGDVREEVEHNGQSTIVMAITVGTQAGQCACDIRNPQGDCCLGNVRAVIKQTQRQEQV